MIKEDSSRLCHHLYHRNSQRIRSDHHNTDTSQPSSPFAKRDISRMQLDDFKLYGKCSRFPPQHIIDSLGYLRCYVFSYSTHV